MLLVGESGTGKTAVCEAAIASALLQSIPGRLTRWTADDRTPPPALMSARPVHAVERYFAAPAESRGDCAAATSVADVCLVDDADELVANLKGAAAVLATAVSNISVMHGRGCGAIVLVMTAKADQAVGDSERAWRTVLRAMVRAHAAGGDVRTLRLCMPTVLETATFLAQLLTNRPTPQAQHAAYEASLAARGNVGVARLVMSGGFFTMHDQQPTAVSSLGLDLGHAVNVRDMARIADAAASVALLRSSARWHSHNEASHASDLLLKVVASMREQR